MARPNIRGSPEIFTKSQVRKMGHSDHTRNNKILTQPNSDTSSDKEWEPAKPESINISSTETTQVIFESTENRYSSILTSQVGSLLLQAW